MKTTEIANRSVEAYSLGIIIDMLQCDFDYVDKTILEKMAENLTIIMNDIAKPVQESITKSK